jgi:CRISPR-associated protein (TIGR02710 family)
MEDLKQQIQQAWQNLKTQELEGTKAQALYNQTVWPLLLKLWQHEPQVYPSPETFEVSIHTLGTSPEATTLAALGLGAGEIYVLHTPESKRYLEQLQHDLGRSVYPVEIGKSDVTRLYQVVGEQVRKHPGKKIALDLTSGTKAMSAGMAAAGYFLQRVHPSLRVAYVDNDAFDAALRKPVAGTEKLILLPNPHEVLGDLDEHLAQELYEAREFGKAAERFISLRRKTGQGGFDLYAAACEMYKHWYALDFESALSNARRLLDFMELDAYRSHFLVRHMGRLRVQKEGLEAIVALLRSQNLSDAVGALWLTASLIQLGDERRERQPVLAALYYYRSLELILQYRLARMARDADNPNLSEEEQQAMRVYLGRWLNDKPENIRLFGKLGLLEAVALLRHLGDTSVDFPDSEMQGYQGVLKGRNKSLLIHGLQVSKKGELEKLREFSRKLYQKAQEETGLNPAVEPVSLA